jgi:hypothetical protein
MAVGSFKLWPLSKDGQLIDYPRPAPARSAPGGVAGPGAEGGGGVDGGAQKDAPIPPQEDLVAPDPSRPEAFDIYFGVKQSIKDPPPKDQVDLQDKVQRILRTVQLLYSGTDAKSERNQIQFRSYYVRLYRLAQLGLEGAIVSPDIATAALATATSDLIDDEAVNVKRTHLRILGCNAAIASAGCLLLYVLLRLTSSYWTTINRFLASMGIQSSLLANFMLLLMGCFLGVWLSYGIRTTTFTLNDLTVTDSDRLTPVIRLIFAGSLTVILGIVFTIPLVEITIGKMPVTNIATYPMLAFVVGCFCGVSELALPSAVSKRASDFIQSIK